MLLLLVYQWLGATLALFPYTRVWAEQINGFLFELLARFGLAVAHAIPDAFAASLIFALAYGANRLLKRFFKAVEWGFVKVTWLDAEVAPVTARLVLGGGVDLRAGDGLPVPAGLGHRRLQGACRCCSV